MKDVWGMIRIILAFALIVFGGLPAFADEQPKPDPLAAVTAYLTEMKAGNMSGTLSIYTRKSQKMAAYRPNTDPPSVGKKIYNIYQNCGLDKVDVLNGFAVVRYRVTDRKCAPFFLLFEEGKWKLDMYMMKKSFEFDEDREWRFTRDMSPYMYAFMDWTLDPNGVPYPVTIKK